MLPPVVSTPRDVAAFRSRFLPPSFPSSLPISLSLCPIHFFYARSTLHRPPSLPSRRDFSEKEKETEKEKRLPPLSFFIFYEPLACANTHTHAFPSPTYVSTCRGWREEGRKTKHTEREVKEAGRGARAQVGVRRNHQRTRPTPLSLPLPPLPPTPPPLPPPPRRPAPPDFGFQINGSFFFPRLETRRSPTPVSARYDPYDDDHLPAPSKLPSSARAFPLPP